MTDMLDWDPNSYEHFWTTGRTTTLGIFGRLYSINWMRNYKAFHSNSSTYHTRQTHFIYSLTRGRWSCLSRYPFLETSNLSTQISLFLEPSADSLVRENKVERRNYTILHIRFTYSCSIATVTFSSLRCTDLPTHHPQPC